jgi:plasmid stability protein
MSNINVNLPDEVHKKLKSRAGLKGKFLRDYIVEILTDHMSYEFIRDKQVSELRI